MKLRKLNSGIIVNVPLTKYLIDWDRKVSGPQFKVKSFLRPFWDMYTVTEEFRIPGSKLRSDLINWSTKVFLEVSPNATHTKFNKFMHGSRASGFLKTLQHDEMKRDWAIENDLHYVALDDSHLKNLSVKLFSDLGIDL